jgi:hypothetical protein
MSHPRKSTRFQGYGLAAVAVSVVLLAACGGGGSTTTPTAQTLQYSRSYAAGPITGFGSIVINGVHYDETNAEAANTITDDDGANHRGTDLKLGMVAEVQAANFGDLNGTKVATANSITISRLMRGPVDSVGANSLVVFGQTVALTATTVFDDTLSGGLVAIKAGALVTIYGTLDTATGVYTATRIEPEGGAAYYGLRASVTAFDAVAHTLTIGSTVIDVSTASLPAIAIKTGDLVRIKLNTAQVNGKWVAVSVKSGVHVPENVEHSEVEGTITAFTSTTSFSVDGIPVDASNAAFPDGTATLAMGARVEVEGAVTNGVMVATTVKLKSEHKAQMDGNEIDGYVTLVDPVKSTVVVQTKNMLHTTTVSYAGTTVVYSGGTVANLIVGAKVEIHGALAADGTTINADQIKFDN